MEMHALEVSACVASLKAGTAEEKTINRGC